MLKIRKPVILRQNLQAPFRPSAAAPIRQAVYVMIEMGNLLYAVLHDGIEGR